MLFINNFLIRGMKHFMTCCYRTIGERKRERLCCDEKTSTLCQTASYHPVVHYFLIISYYIPYNTSLCSLIICSLFFHAKHCQPQKELFTSVFFKSAKYIKWIIRLLLLSEQVSPTGCFISSITITDPLGLSELSDLSGQCGADYVIQCVLLPKKTKNPK